MAELVILPMMCALWVAFMFGVAWFLVHLGRRAEQARRDGRRARRER